MSIDVAAPKRPADSLGDQHSGPDGPSAMVPFVDFGGVVATMSQRNDVFNSAIKRLRNTEQEIANKDAQLEAQCAAHVAFMEAASKSSEMMSAEIEQLGRLLAKERSARELERSGFQKAANLPKQQVRHISDMHMASDRRIEELEMHIRQLVTYADNEYSRIMEYNKKVEGDLTTFKDLVYRRESQYIELESKHSTG